MPENLIPILSDDDSFLDQVFTGQSYDRMILKRFSAEGCRFVNTRFAEARLIDCRLENCVFVGCDLSLVRLAGTALTDVRFEGCKALAVNWTDTVGLAFGVQFEDCNLADSSFTGMRLRHVQILNSRADRVDFTEADLTGANFGGTDLSGARFMRTDLTCADLACASNYSINPVMNTLKGARFSLPEAVTLLLGLGIDLADG